MVLKKPLKLTFKYNAPLRSCISKINNTFIDNAKDLDFVMPFYNPLEYSNNYSMTSGRWNYYRDKINDSAIENDNANNRINNNKTITKEYFESKTKVTGSTPDDNNILDAEFVVPLKHLSNFGDLLIFHC